MFSKTFDNYGQTRKLHIESASRGLVLLKIEFEGHEEYFTVPNDIVPSISLAVLEASGVEDSSTGGHITGARIAVGDLKRHVKMQERAKAEAKDKAKLEAEALELRNAFSMANGGAPIDSFAGHSVNKPGWIDAARRAREINKETPND